MKNSKGFALAGLGTSLPEYSMSQAEAAELAREVVSQSDEQAALLKVLFRRSGIQTRYTVLPHRKALDYVNISAPEAPRAVTLGPTTRERMEFYRQLAPALAHSAAREALHCAQIEPSSITHLVTVSCTGFAAPGVDVELIGNLPLRPEVQRTHVGFMGCHGALNGLRLARALVLADPAAKVLLCAVELCSLHYRFHWDPDRMLGNALFSDGSAAVVGVHTDRCPAAWQLVASGSCVFPQSQDAMTWQIGDHGFEMTLSPKVPDQIGQNLPHWLDAWLGEQGLLRSDVRTWAVHPGGPRILSAVQQSLGFAENALTVSREVLRDCGNMSSPTVLFIIERLQARGAERPCVALGFGPGLAVEAALFL